MQPLKIYPLCGQQVNPVVLGNRVSSSSHHSVDGILRKVPILGFVCNAAIAAIQLLGSNACVGQEQPVGGLKQTPTTSREGRPTPRSGRAYLQRQFANRPSRRNVLLQSPVRFHQGRSHATGLAQCKAAAGGARLGTAGSARQHPGSADGSAR